MSKRYNKRNTQTGQMVRFDWDGANEPTEDDIAAIEKSQGSIEAQPSFLDKLTSHPLDAVKGKLGDVSEFIGHEIGNAPIPRSLGDIAAFGKSILPSGLREGVGMQGDRASISPDREATINSAPAAFKDNAAKDFDIEQTKDRTTSGMTALAAVTPFALEGASALAKINPKNALLAADNALYKTGLRPRMDVRAGSVPRSLPDLEPFGAAEKFKLSPELQATVDESIAKGKSDIKDWRSSTADSDALRARIAREARIKAQELDAMLSKAP